MKKKDAAYIASCLGNAEFRRRSGHHSSSGCARVCINHVVTGQALCLAESRTKYGRARVVSRVARINLELRPHGGSLPVTFGGLTGFHATRSGSGIKPIRIGGGKCWTDGNVRDVRTQREREPSCCTAFSTNCDSQQALRTPALDTNAVLLVATRAQRVFPLLFVFGRCPLRCLNPPPADTSDIACTYQ